MGTGDENTTYTQNIIFVHSLGIRTFDGHSWKTSAQISEVSFTRMSHDCRSTATENSVFHAFTISHETVSVRKYQAMTHLVSRFSILASFVFIIWLSFRISRVVSWASISLKKKEIQQCNNFLKMLGSPYREKQCTRWPDRTLGAWSAYSNHVPS